MKRGLLLILRGSLISIVTTILMPQDRVMFGILTLLGACTLPMVPLERILDRHNPIMGLSISMMLFVLTCNVNIGCLGFENWNICKLPSGWYRNLVTAFLGFPAGNFYSTDYFSLFPWVFLSVSGYYFHRICCQNHWLKYLQKEKTNVLDWLGAL